MGKLYLLFFSMFVFLAQVSGQTTITTSSTSTTNWSTGSNALVFGVENTNSYDIIITDLSNYTPASHSATYTLWYHPTVISGAPGTIDASNGWVQTSASAAISGTSAGLTTIFSGISLTIPANTTYRLALVSTSNGPYYGPNGSGLDLYSGGGVNIHTQNSSVSPTYVGPFPSSVTNTPRVFYGSITFIPGVPCTAPPVAGAATASPTTGICIGASISLGLTGNTGGSGQTYQWEESVNPNGPWTPVGASSGSPSLSISATTTKYYRVAVSCNSQTA